jgi:predicted RNA-binding Zn-ribbon protein involved in translation (DUF1610 family)
MSMIMTTYAVLFPCPKCGHHNKVHKRVRNSLILWLLDRLPPCKKCGYQLRKVNYHAPRGTPYVEKLKKELGLS